MTDAILFRATPPLLDSRGTFGVFWIQEQPICITCELPWLNNEPDKSCIPVGTYNCVRHISQKFPAGNTWEITNVPNRTVILIHPANDCRELLGCIAPGTYFGTIADQFAVLGSNSALELLNKKLESTFTLTIQ